MAQKARRSEKRQARGNQRMTVVKDYGCSGERGYWFGCLGDGER